MAESKFIKFQDENGDRLIDICEVELPGETKKCLSCKPNPLAVVTNWTNRANLSVTLNEKKCLYELVYQTDLTGTVSDRTNSANDAFELFKEKAVEAFFESGDKKKTPDAITAVSEAIEFTSFDLLPRGISFLKLLYSIPFEVYENLEPADPDEDDEDEGPISVVFDADKFKITMIRVRKGLHLYSRYQMAALYVGEGLKFAKSGKPLDVGKYGDFVGLAQKDSKLKDVYNQIGSFLREKGYTLSPIAFRDKVTKIKFVFTKEYQMKKMSIKTIQCKEKWIHFTKGSKLKTLVNRPLFKDKTAMAYLANARDMETDLTARSPMPWADFLIKYTYPEVLGSTTMLGTAEAGTGTTIVSCIADNLENEAKELGQYIFDEGFGIFEATAMAFREEICFMDDEVRKQRRNKIKDDPRSAKQLAKVHLEQSFKNEHYMFENLCEVLFGIAPDGPFDFHYDMLGELYANLDTIRLCGLLDFMMEGVRCLMGGLSLEEALSKMCAAALRAMSLENLDKLFIGLPPEKQTEIAAVVQSRLNAGQLPGFISTGENIQTLDATYDAATNLNLPVPPFSGYHKANPREEPKEEDPNLDQYGNEIRGSVTSDPINNRTLAQQYDGSTLAGFGGAEQPDTILGIWIEAILEVYASDLLGLTDLLNKFPGAQLIANIISLIDCPKPPIFNPSLLDFLNSIDLPFCRNGNPIVLPRLDLGLFLSPFRLIIQAIKDAFFQAVRNAVVRIILAILKKVCEIIGNAICKALELVGDLAIATFSRQNFKDLVNKTLCDGKADEQLATDSIVDMLQKYGADATALADSDRVNDFIGDIGSVMTAEEMAEAFLGNASEEAMRTLALLVENRYPEFSNIFGSPRDIAEFFDMMGNVAPAEALNTLADNLDSLGQQFQPANPSLCATQDQIDNFCAFRTSVLEGRCTPEELNLLCDNARTQNNALDDLADILQNGIPNMIEAGLPPLISEPGCDDGIVPFMDEQDVNVGSQALSNTLEQLKIDFTMDMIGNGPGEKNWGMINLLLCDTDSDPLTTHIRQTERNTLFFKKKNVDFYVDAGSSDDANYAALYKQHGAYPQYVAEWLFDPALSSSYEANKKVQFSNSYDERKVVHKGEYQGNFDLLGSYDYGYKFDYIVDYTDDKFKVVRSARKSEPDIVMHYQDNLNGDGGGDNFGYGFKLRAFMHDIEQKEDQYVNTEFDSTRVILTDLYKSIDFSSLSKEQNRVDDNGSSSETIETKGDKYMKSKRMEFFTIENTFENAIDELPDFKEHFQTHLGRLPQLSALNNLTGIALSGEQYDNICDSLLSQLKDSILSSTENERGFLYGAQFNDLSGDDGSGFSDVDYGVNRNGEFILYSDYASDNDLSNDDRILGISYMKFKEKNLGGPKNRVHYLDPELYGGSYLNPKVYIEPAKNEGWLGMVDVMFPELSPCKPYRVELVDFAEIQSQISSEYQNVPQDKRLSSDPDCVVEKPFNRILGREDKIGIAVTIRAICRIYAAAHIVKTLPVFTKIKPDFTTNIGDIYTQYIVEEMAENFKEAQDNFEFLNTFKDSEFWYSFLEQAVQYYSDLINEGKITNPPAHVIAIMRKLNDVQESYIYPSEDDLKSEEAKDTSLGLRLRRSSRIKEYRFRKNLEAVKTVEAECKIILKEILKQETQKMADVFVENAKNVNLIDPDNYIYNMGYYFLQEVCEGNSLTLNKEIKIEIVDFESKTGNQLYTDGGEFSIASTGADYAGYYHSYVDDDGDVIFKTGEVETGEEGQEKLLPLADLQVVNIGDLEEISRLDRTKRFQVVKYLKENGERKDTSRIFDIIQENEGSMLNISDIYPGTLEVVEIEEQNEALPFPTKKLGLRGELGLRYGMALFYKGREITSVEVDLLDLPISQAQPLKPNSKLLLCLINNMVDDPKFKLVTEYIFPMKKFAALTAIYTDYALFPSIGEVTKEDDENPGGTLSIDEDTGIATISYVPGWRRVSKRKKGGLFYLKWDEWDRQILRKSTHRTKKLFKQYYEGRDFLPGDATDEKPGQQFLKQIIESIKPAPGQRLLPWFRRRSGNPLNADGQVCKNRE